MKKIKITEEQFKNNKTLIESCGCNIIHNDYEIEEGKKATIHVANQVKNATNRPEYHYNDTFDNHEKKKISLAKFLDAPYNIERLKRGTEIIDSDGNKGKLQGLKRLKRGYAVNYLDKDGTPTTKSSFSVFIMV